MADATLSSSSHAVMHKRSRAGCHTCKSRKVKCERRADISGDDNPEAPSQCANCQRLGFQCRWQAPLAGEGYIPPPKRRRTIGQRRREPLGEIQDATTAGLKEDDAQDMQQNSGSSAMPASVASPPDGGGQPFNAQFDMFGDLPFELDFGVASGIIDLSLAGEGLDFVPLPVVDASMLQDLVNFTTSPSYLTSSSDQLSSLATAVTQATNSSSAVGTSTSLHTSVDSNNRHIIQHYLDVMKGYAKVDDRTRDANNLFISAFTKSLHFPPLFHSILAFSASHLAMEDSSYAGQAREFTRLAGESFDSFRRAESFEADGLLSALFVRVKTVHMLAGSVDSFLDLIAAAVDIVATKWPEVADSDDVLSTLTGRIIIRLAILDARASYHRLGGGRLVNLLREMPVFSSLFSRDLPPTGSSGALLNLLRAGILRMTVADLDIRLHEQLESEFVTRAPIRTGEVKGLYERIQYEIHQWNDDMAKRMDMPNEEEILIRDHVLDSTEYGYYIVLSALHSALLYLCITYPLPSFHPEHSISKVMHCQLKISHDTSRATSPSSILPSSLFMVGLMTSDPVHRHWILQLLKTGEEWGIYAKKARELLEAMLRQPSGSDVRDTMDRVTGRFII